MKNKNRKRICVSVLLGLASFTSSTHSLADDTDIFFPPPTTIGDAHPNVLFLLDNSGSMDWDFNGRSTSDYFFTPPTRIDSLKGAFARIIDSAANMNVGLSRLHQNNSTSNSSPNIYYDVDGIDDILSASTVPVDGGTFVKHVGSAADDAKSTIMGTIRSDRAHLALDNIITGMRFRNIDIPDGAVIESAYVDITASSTVYSAPNFKVEIKAHAADDSNESLDGNNPINLWPTVEESALWEVSSSHVLGTTYRSPDIKDVIADVLSRPGWVSGNALTVLFNKLDLNPNDGIDESNTHRNLFRFYAHDTSPVNSAKLTINYSGTSLTTTYRVRDQIKEYVNSMEAKGGTPTVAQMVSAKNYFSGSNSPAQYSCQKNYIFLLSDGQPGYSSSAVTDTENITGEDCSNSYDCGPLLARWMANSDAVGASVNGDNPINTYTVGFGADETANAFLRNVASAGGGQFRAAASADELVDAFERFYLEVADTDSTFVAPAATVNQFNQLEHKNEIYYALFKPNARTDWAGNVKRYQLAYDHSDDEFKIVDNSPNPIEAVNPETGFFVNAARSFWLPSGVAADGNTTGEGGAARNLPNSRNVYTDLGAGDGVFTLTTSPVNTSNSLITNDILGVASSTERTNVINWARGLDEDGNNRRAIGDPLHSQPALATYNCRPNSDGNRYVDNDPANGCVDTDDAWLFFGTNQGYLHAVSTATGVETFSYIPSDLLGNLNTYSIDPVANNVRPYGLDGTPTIWRKDENANGVIETAGKNDDHVYLYIGMRRGGRNYYALDVTNPGLVSDDGIVTAGSPKLLWKISGGSGDFAKLGQTWSTPVKTKIRVSSGSGNNTTESVKEVLIFGGGYDPDQDDANERTADDIGNAIYIVDATDGSLVWSASNDDNHNLNLPGMDYSIPGEIQLLDLNQDGFPDQLFVGDVGGQVWRLYFNHGASANNLLQGAGSGGNLGVMARLSTANSTEHARRFYNKPSVALIDQNGKALLTVAIGSGFRANPIDEVITDRFYVLKTAHITQRDSSYTPLTDSDLYNITTNPLDSNSASDQQRAQAQNRLDLVAVNSEGVRTNVLHDGFYINMTRDGEKVLSDASIFAGILTFNSYEPELAADSCNPVIGINRLYSVDVANGRGQLEGETNAEINNTGIVSGGTTMMINTDDLVILNPPSAEGGNTTPPSAFGSCDRVPVVIHGLNVTKLDCEGSVKKTYWMDEEV
ncbi:PilC/PilY family type IV pilus protein [Parendozoicomonas sp. Alg238-R29]|uniref:PilC/PilY family type IV pilus protein n=1 Tax=Parendozoicomonas sp. Alg238-R29 TaxID=2993446 RepID=UPI00248EEF08|nr:PilC/PilY family type IV pilus protein [Parendozoicomonas sp. Alg238-R29]